jgi:hypothetical protein
MITYVLVDRSRWRQPGHRPNSALKHRQGTAAERQIPAYGSDVVAWLDAQGIPWRGKPPRHWIIDLDA